MLQLPMVPEVFQPPVKGHLLCGETIAWSLWWNVFTTVYESIVRSDCH